MTNLTAVEPSGTATLATLCEAFDRTVRRFPDRVALRTAGGEQEITWREYAERVRLLAAGLAGLGYGRGDTVALMMTNRPEAFLADTAVLHVGATPFSIYTSSSLAQITYMLNHAEARVVIVDSQFAQRILEARPALPNLEHVYVVGDPVEGAETFADLAAAARPDFDFESSWRAVTPDDVAVLIYTSGTTGVPKAVETTHANVIASRVMWTGAFPELARPGRYMSYLPMAHMADRQVAHYPSLVTGSTVTTFTDPRTAMGSLREVRPTLSATVPRMWEKLKAGLEAQFAQNPDVRKAVDAAMARVRLEMAGEPVPGDLAEATRRADEAIFSKIRAQIGYDDVDVLMSGAAPIGEEVLVFFAALGLPIVEVWGMSETSTCGTANPKDGIRIGTVGKPLPGLELVLAEDGELLLRGAAVMRGYRNDPEKTAEALDSDGFLHTGDVGQIDEDGYVRIVDRKKDLIISAGGKNMAPSHIESKIKAGTNLIGNVVAIGDRRPYNTALIVLDPEEAAAFAAEHGIADTSAAALAADESVREHIDAAVQEGNSSLSRIEQVKRFTILPEFWEPDSDVLTPTMKLKRKPISERYAAEIDAMYAR